MLGSLFEAINAKTKLAVVLISINSQFNQFNCTTASFLIEKWPHFFYDKSCFKNFCVRYNFMITTLIV